MIVTESVESCSVPNACVRYSSSQLSLWLVILITLCRHFQCSTLPLSCDAVNSLCSTGQSLSICEILSSMSSCCFAVVNGSAFACLYSLHPIRRQQSNTVSWCGQAGKQLNSTHSKLEGSLYHMWQWLRHSADAKMIQILTRWCGQERIHATQWPKYGHL